MRFGRNLAGLIGEVPGLRTVGPGLPNRQMRKDQKRI